MEVDDATDGGKGEFVVEVKFFFWWMWNAELCGVEGGNIGHIFKLFM